MWSVCLNWQDAVIMLSPSSHAGKVTNLRVRDRVETNEETKGKGGQDEEGK